jgi:ACS family tartrate transporter-like MFS transporter
MEIAPFQEQTFRTLIIRLVPCVFVGNLLLQFDRSNVSFAALQMDASLRLGPEAYGFGAGIFFLGYALFGVPSNYVIARIGAPIWITRLMIVWGLIATALAFTVNAPMFFVLRFMLGVAEAGFTPGVLVYLSGWIPARRFSTTFGIFSVSAPLAGILVGPISAALLSIDALGIEGWRWMFLIEGIPTVLLGTVLIRWLPRSIADVAWLGPEQKSWLRAEVAPQRDVSALPTRRQFLAGLTSPRVWGYCITYFALLSGIYAVTYWLPQIVKATSHGMSTTAIGWISTVPYLFAAALLFIVPRLADRLGDRRWHLVVLGVVGGASLLLSTVVSSPVLAFLALSVSLAAAYSYMGIFWSGPTTTLAAGGLAAAGIALINSLGNVGGFVGPYMFGFVRSVTGDFMSGLKWFTLFFAVAALIPLLFPESYPRARAALAQVDTEKLSAPS